MFNLFHWRVDEHLAGIELGSERPDGLFCGRSDCGHAMWTWASRCEEAEGENERHQAMSAPQDEKGVLVSELAGDADMVELVEMFVEELPDRVAAIEKALADQDFETLAGLTHQLKGTAGGYGFPTITDASKEAELTCKAADDLEKLASDVKALSELCCRARATTTEG